MTGDCREIDWLQVTMTDAQAAGIVIGSKSDVDSVLEEAKK